MADNVPAARVKSIGFDDLIPVARRLNTSSDDLNAALKRIEDRLNELGIGIGRFVPIPETRQVVSDGQSEPEQWSEYQVGYDRGGDGWALLTRRAHFRDDPTMTAAPEQCWEFDEEKPLLRSSRELRIKAVAAIPQLLKQLKDEAEGVLQVVDNARRLAGEKGRQIEFEFGETEQSKAFFDRNPTFWLAFEKLMALTNKAFGREVRFTSRVEDICFNLGQTCRQDFIEVLFLAANGYGIGAEKILRGLYERAVALEYMRTKPEKAERFMRYAAIQEYKGAKAALEVVSKETFDATMGPGNSFDDIAGRFEEVKPEFQQTDCKKCKTTETAFSWDIDVASMVKKVGEPFTKLYLMGYTMPTLHIHATLASAYEDESRHETPEERNLHEAETSLMCATMIFLAVIRSQNQLFKLGLEQELDIAWAETEAIWTERHDARLAARQ